MQDDLIERLRATRYTERWPGFCTDRAINPDGPEAADRIAALEAENERLRKALRGVFEEWAGSEGFIPETAPEGYLLHLTKRMADIARAALEQGEPQCRMI